MPPPITRLTLQCLAQQTQFATHPTMSACWLWTGRVGNGSPVAYYDGQDRSARLGTWRLFRGDKHVGQLRPDCGRQLCVNPRHMKASA